MWIHRVCEVQSVSDTPGFHHWPLLLLQCLCDTEWSQHLLVDLLWGGLRTAPGGGERVFGALISKSEIRSY